jgi:LysM repeat protein
MRKKTIMKFKFLLAVLFVTLSLSASARTLFDSVGVENQGGKKVILHKLDPKDNFYSIARHYGVSPKAVIQFNPNVKMSIGAIVKVPTERPFNEQVAVNVKPVKQPSQTVQSKAAVIPSLTQSQQAANTPVNNTATETTVTTTQYKVSPGETLYAISRRFNTKVDEIIKMNNLKSSNLTPGQILLVKATPPPAPEKVKTAEVAIQPPPPVIAKRDTTRIVATQTDSADTAAPHIPANRYGLSEKNEKGVAVWTDKDDLDPSKKLVLHRTAPVGTVVKITNPMTNRTTFAKVVGRFTENENTKDVIMVMTKNVAESLGAIDKRFRVNISYGTTNE